MRKIEVPAAIVLKIGAKEEELPFAKFVETVVNAYDLFGKGLENIRKGGKILDATSKAGPGQEVSMEDDHWNALKAASAAFPWRPEAARQLVPYMEAIEKAKESK